MKPVTRTDLIRGDFPLRHDCVLIVRHSDGRQYFTGSAIELPYVARQFAKLSCVRSVEIVLISDFDEVYRNSLSF